MANSKSVTRRLNHIEKEFEKIHDAYPNLAARLSSTETWISLHPQLHVAEGRAVIVAQEAQGKKMIELNDVRNRFVDKEEYRRDHNRLTAEINNLRASRDTSAGEKGLLDQFWPLLLALAMLAVGHFWK
jgi:hypothetical protein